MSYDYKKELERVKKHYEGDPLQKRFSALVTGETNAGKTYLLNTARFPVHIDSFDPGGSKCLEPWIKKGDIVVDTSFEREDPFDPTAYAQWKKSTEIRFQIGYFDHFGTYALDSLTTFGDAVMGSVMAGAKGGSRAGEVPMHRRDYNPQKVEIVNYIRKLMNLTCDFILTGHLRRNDEILNIDKISGVVSKLTEYRLHVTGQAVITIPLLFDELWVLTGTGNPPKRDILTDSLGKYIARSRLKKNEKLDAKESPNIKEILKKAGFGYEDKPKLEI